MNGSIRFCEKVFKNYKTSDFFPVNTKTVNTRPDEKYVVTRARTERLAKSALSAKTIE